MVRGAVVFGVRRVLNAADNQEVEPHVQKAIEEQVKALKKDISECCALALIGHYHFPPLSLTQFELLVY